MNFAAISDVHGNLEALQAVLKDIQQRNIDRIFFLGDAVGYGPNPNECVEILKDTCSILLAGNHDWATLGLTDIDYFNEYAKAAVLWTRKVLTEESRRIIGTFPIIKSMKKENMLLVHASPKEPEAWHYLLTLWDAEINFHYFRERICIIGHSHMPFVIERLPSGEMITYRKEALLGGEKRYIINSGSVGQPRDRDSRACYVTIDDNRAKIVRVEYNREETERKMHEAGLPLPLIERLSRGT
jgi:predicted phosphodiesterase